MLLANELKTEIDSIIDAQKDKAFPFVLMFIDASAIFWVTNNGYYIWMDEHRGIDDFLDFGHKEVERRYTDKSTEGVSLHGTYWINSDFNCPFGVLDFYKRIEEINILAD